MWQYVVFLNEGIKKKIVSDKFLFNAFVLEETVDISFAYLIQINLSIGKDALFQSCVCRFHMNWAITFSCKEVEIQYK